MTHKNRLTNTDVDQMPIAAERPPTVRAILVHAWRCPNCTKFRLSQMSSTHFAKCEVCGAEFTVEIR